MRGSRLVWAALAIGGIGALLWSTSDRLPMRGERAAPNDTSNATADPTKVKAKLVASVVGPLARLQPATSEQLSGTRSIELHAARGEREGSQLVVRSQKGRARVVVESSALRSADGARISARNVRTYIQQPMRVEKGSPAGRSGVYVDPLRPAAQHDVVVKPGDPLLAWVDVAVPWTARPGTYRGTVTVRAARKNGQAISQRDPLANIPLTLKVYRATLPVRPTLGSHVGVDASQLIRFEGVEAGSPELRASMAEYGRVLADARLSIGDVGVDVPTRGSPQAARDRAYLRDVFTAPGVASVRIPFYMDHPFADPLGRDRAAARSYLRNAAEWAREEGFLSRAFIFAIDEPDDALGGDVRELRELLGEADPALRLLVTREPQARSMRGNVDIWAPNINPQRLDWRAIKRERQAGREVWWYPSITTWQPYPTLFIDELRPTPRALGWLAYTQGIDGVLYWSATHWHEVKDPWRDPGTYNEPGAVGNGDGVLLYPGGPVGEPGIPQPSVRLLQLRDGIEDHDLLVTASCAASERVNGRLFGQARRLAPRIDAVSAADSQQNVTQMRRLALTSIAAAGDPARCRA